MASNPRSLVPVRVPPLGFRRRLFLVGTVAIGAFGFLGGRLWDLQVRRGEHYRGLSDHNRIRLKRVRATRGLVVDRNGKPLVENRPAFDVIMVPEDAGMPRAVLARLEGFLGEEIPEAREVLGQNGHRPPFEPVVLRRDVDRPTLVTVETRRFELPGVSLAIGPRRSYLEGSIIAHVIGYIGEVTQRELEELEGYRMSDMIGRYGLEKRFEPHLRGENGGRQIEVDALGQELRVLQEVSPVPGASLHLTIDLELQKAAFDALEGREGAVVAIDPRTGGVLASVSRPSFDPNLFANGIGAEDWKRLVSDPLRPMNDRALQGQYAPGSVFKVVVATAALEEGIVNPFTTIYCPGFLRFGRRDFRCWRREGHGSMNLHQAIVQSCDVYFYQVGQRLGVDAIADYARRFGFDRETGVAPGHEKPGTIPDSAWKKRALGEPWYPGETLSVAIGQGYVTATPIQVANMMATVAAGGIRRTPYFVDTIETPSGQIVEPERREPSDTRVRPSTLNQVREALRDVVGSERGTARRARVAGFEVAGKTGTSQTVRLRREKVSGPVARHERDHAWFAAFAPVEQPEIAVAAVVEHAGEGGGRVAAPVVQRVLSRYFGVPVEEETSGSS